MTDQAVRELRDLYAPEELNDALVPFLGQYEHFEALKHPLVFSVPYVPQMNRILNRQFEAKRRAIGEAIEEGAWNRFVFLHEKPYRCGALQRIADNLTDFEFWKLLASVWCTSENVHEWGDDVIRSLFGAPRERREFLMTARERRAFRAMPDRLTIFRGHQHVNVYGWSWTVDRERAEWFARRFGGDGDIVSATIRKADAIAYFEGEEEVVVDPRRFEP